MSIFTSLLSNLGGFVANYYTGGMYGDAGGPGGNTIGGRVGGIYGGGSGGMGGNLMGMLNNNGGGNMAITGNNGGGGAGFDWGGTFSGGADLLSGLFGRGTGGGAGSEPYNFYGIYGGKVPRRTTEGEIIRDNAGNVVWDQAPENRGFGKYENVSTLGFKLEDMLKGSDELNSLPRGLYDATLNSIAPIQGTTETLSNENINQWLADRNLRSGYGADRESSPYEDLLREAITNPSFGTTSKSEESLINELISRTQGASALRGLGPSTAGGIARNIAPELINLRQQRIGNLQRAFTEDIAPKVAQRGQELVGRGQDIDLSQIISDTILGRGNLEARGADIRQSGILNAANAAYGRRGQDIGLLQYLINQVQPRNTVLQGETSGGGGGILSGMFS
jgi:hypothetical protein